MRTQRISATLSATGIKTGQMLEAASAQNWRPTVLWWVVHAPEFLLRMIYDRDRLGVGRRYLLVLALKIDGLVVVDPALGAQQKV